MAASIDVRIDFRQLESQPQILVRDEDAGRVDRHVPR
jgi:hypothetical protein